MGTGASVAVEAPVGKDEAQKLAGPKWDEEKFAEIATEGDKISVDVWTNLVDVAKKFDFYDTDSDGYLSPAELSLLLKESGYVDEEMLAKYIAEMMLKKTDQNHDGKLDYGEFIRVYKALQKHYQAGLDNIDTSSGKHAPIGGADEADKGAAAATEGEAPAPAPAAEAAPAAEEGKGEAPAPAPAPAAEEVKKDEPAPAPAAPAAAEGEAAPAPAAEEPKAAENEAAASAEEAKPSE